MKLTIENRPAIHDPTPAQIERGLRKLRSGSRTEFAILEADDGSYVQTAGSGAGCMLEWHQAASGEHFRGYQEPAIAPFEDGTTLVFAGSEVALRKEEWFKLSQVIEVLQAFSESRPFPTFVAWRDITNILQ